MKRALAILVFILGFAAILAAQVTFPYPPAASNPIKASDMLANFAAINTQFTKLDSGNWSKVTGGINYAGGNIGIGSASPVANDTLTLSGNNNGIALGAPSANGGYAEVSANSGIGYFRSNTYWGSPSNRYVVPGYAAWVTVGILDGSIRFWTAPSGLADAAMTATERMQISNSGHVGIGQSNPVDALDVTGNVVVTGSVWASGAILTSDQRLKKDIATLPGALDSLEKLRGVTFHWIDPAKGAKTQYGVIAQEVEKVYPDLVDTDAKGMKSVNYNGFVAPLIESIKELKTENDSLQKENADLRKRLDAIEAKLGM